MMDRPGVTLLGLGPGDPRLLTRQAWEILENSQEIFLRTSQHPVVRDLPAPLKINSFDHLYESGETFDWVYEQIIDEILKLAIRPQGVLYAVPGHPFVAETTGSGIAKQARMRGLAVQVVHGISFLEPVLTALQIDVFPQTALVDSFELSRLHIPPFPPNVPAVISQIHSRMQASEIKLILNTLYPDEHPVKLVHAAGTSNEIVENLMLFEVDRSTEIGLMTTLYIPPLEEGAAFEAFQEVVAHLRAEDGCPWDREQTHATLRADLLEETYEVLSAIDADDPAGMREELGDLLLLLFLHVQIAADNGEFTMPEVLQGIYEKIIWRHPHVFGDLELDDPQQVLRNWERLKAEERLANGKENAGLLDGVSPVLPALLQADEYQKRAARVGFDWPDIRGVLEKVAEELAEVRAARGEEDLSREIGDLLFAVVNLARWYSVEPESALREANTRFRKRFSHIEAHARAQQRSLNSLTLEEMEALWQEAKRM